jgi:hypothetical protein
VQALRCFIVKALQQKFVEVAEVIEVNGWGACNNDGTFCNEGAQMRAA